MHRLGTSRNLDQENPVDQWRFCEEDELVSLGLVVVLLVGVVLVVIVIVVVMVCRNRPAKGAHSCAPSRPCSATHYLGCSQWR